MLDPPYSRPKVGRPVAFRDYYRRLVTFGSVDIEKLLEAQLPKEQELGNRQRKHETEYRPYVDLDGSGNYYLCFINSIRSVASISVSLCPTKTEPHLAFDDFTGKERPIELPSYRESLEVSVLRLRLYSRVAIKDHNGEMWPGEITRAQPDGMFRVRDPIHGDYAFPVGRADLSRLGPALDHPVGYFWSHYGEEEDLKEVVALSRDDLEVAIINSEAANIETIPVKTQIEWLQSRLVMSPAAIGGQDASSWAAAGFADGTIDLWAAKGEKMFTLQHGEPVTFVYIAPSGSLLVSASSSYAVYWDIPKDSDLGKAGRLPNREPFSSRYFQSESLAQDLFDPEDCVNSEYVMPPELQCANLLTIGNATAVPDQTAVWVVASSTESVLLWGLTQRSGWLKAQSWQHPEGDPVVAAEVCHQHKKTAEDAELEATSRRKGKAAAAHGGPTHFAATSKSRTQVIIFTTRSGALYTVHAGGFPVSSVVTLAKKALLKRRQGAGTQRRSAQSRASLAAEVSDEAMALAVELAGAGDEASTDPSSSSSSSRKGKGVWGCGGSVLQRIQPEREREHRLTQVQKIEAQIQALWRDHNADPRFKHGNHPDRSSNTSDRLEEEVKLLRRRVIDMEVGVMREHYTSAIDLMLKKKEYLDKHDVETSVVDCFVCGEVMRAVLLIREDPVNKQHAVPKFFMRLVDIRRDPRVSHRDVAPRHHLLKVDDSCELTTTWPRVDPSFFDLAAVAYIQRSLGFGINGYEGSFSYMSSKDFFESTLDIAFDHMVEEKRNDRLRRRHDGKPVLLRSSSNGHLDDDDDDLETLKVTLQPPPLGLTLRSDEDGYLYIERLEDLGGRTTLLDLRRGDRVVSANGDRAFGFMAVAQAETCFEQLLRTGSLTVVVERLGESTDQRSGLFESTMNEGPVLGMRLEARSGLLLVKRVVQGGPAFLAGVRAGDRLLSVNDDDSFALKGTDAASADLVNLLRVHPHKVHATFLRSAQHGFATAEDGLELMGVTSIFRGIGLVDEDPTYEAVKVRVPKGARAGDTIEFKVQGGRSARAKIPAGKVPGQLMEIKVLKLVNARDHGDRVADAAEAYAQAQRVGAEAEAKAHAKVPKELLTLEVPLGAVPGAVAEFNVNGRVVRVPVPDGKKAGELFQALVPKAPEEGSTLLGALGGMVGGFRGPTVVPGVGKAMEDEVGTLKVKLPLGAFPSQVVSYTLPTGRTVTFTVPADAKPGMVVSVRDPDFAAPRLPADFSRPTYDVVFSDAKLGISLVDQGAQLPIVDENNDPGAALPRQGDLLVAINGESLLTYKYPYQRMAELVTSLDRPVTITFIDCAPPDERTVTVPPTHALLGLLGIRDDQAPPEEPAPPSPPGNLVLDFFGLGTSAVPSAAASADPAASVAQAEMDDKAVEATVSAVVSPSAVEPSDSAAVDRGEAPSTAKGIFGFLRLGGMSKQPSSKEPSFKEPSFKEPLADESAFEPAAELGLSQQEPAASTNDVAPTDDPTAPKGPAEAAKIPASTEAARTELDQSSNGRSAAESLKSDARNGPNDRSSPVQARGLLASFSGPSQSFDPVAEAPAAGEGPSGGTATEATEARANATAAVASNVASTFFGGLFGVTAEDKPLSITDGAPSPGAESKKEDSGFFGFGF